MHVLLQRIADLTLTRFLSPIAIALYSHRAPSKFETSDQRLSSMPKKFQVNTRCTSFHFLHSQALQLNLFLQVDIDKPLGLVLGESKAEGGGLVVKAAGGNAAKVRVLLDSRLPELSPTRSMV